jgi:hypothetical protein
MQHQNSVSYPLDYLYKPVTKSRNIRCPSFSAVARALCPSGLLHQTWRQNLTFGFLFAYVWRMCSLSADLRLSATSDKEAQNNEAQSTMWKKKIKELGESLEIPAPSPPLFLSLNLSVSRQIAKMAREGWVECRQTTKAEMIKMWVENVSGREILWLVLGRVPSQPPLVEINRRSCRQLINSSCACIRQVEGGIDFTSLRCAKVTFQDFSGLSTLGLRRSLRNLGRIKLKDRLPPSSPRLLSSRFLSKNMNIKIYWNIILPVVLCGCETWSLTLREKHRLRVSENRVMRKVFGRGDMEVEKTT